MDHVKEILDFVKKTNPDMTEEKLINEIIFENHMFLSKSSRTPPTQHFQCRRGMNAFLCKFLDIFY